MRHSGRRYASLSAGRPSVQPSARPAVVAPPLTSTLPDQPEIADVNSSAPPAAVSVPVSSIPGSADAGPAGPVVHAAVTSQPAAAPSASGAARVEPALAQSSGIMVQIASVSHAEDADVLVGALRKRGYAVTSRRDPADGLLHVEVGPFANRTDAYATRQNSSTTATTPSSSSEYEFVRGTGERTSKGRVGHNPTGIVGKHICENRSRDSACRVRSMKMR